ncbi:MAG: AIPR family protein [Nanoarchaeota archaeon]|nr:AIPR family protein [Nanoarchaeota archaeon]
MDKEILISYNDVQNMIDKLSKLSSIEQTKELTKFYFVARFDVSLAKFENHYVDGKDDGGIDLFYSEDNTFHIFQSKFTNFPKKCNIADIEPDLIKIFKTISIQNPNEDAKEFVESIKNNLNNPDKNLEIVWITTNIIQDSVREEANKIFNKLKRENNWKINVDLYFVDKSFLETVIYDLKHGYVPYTGKKVLDILPNELIIHNGSSIGIKSIVCVANINNLLSWFDDDRYCVNNFLQKNVRGFVGDTIINEEIGESYSKEPDLFWFKHNGIIIFADDFFFDKNEKKIFLRNPQIVNGGQTVKKLYSIYKKENGKISESSRVLIRIYRLAYENSETYKKSIDIISALNSQNKIYKSDLRSNDPTQVMLENHLSKLNYKYERKRSEGIKSTKDVIKMRDLARLYYYCKKNSPNQGIIAQVEELFEEEDKYEEIFDQDEINKELYAGHVIINYLTCWNIDYNIRMVNKHLSKRDKIFFYLIRFYIVNEIYQKLKKWKIRQFRLGWRHWVEFLESNEFNDACYRFSKPLFRKGREMIPRDEEPKNFFRRKEVIEKFSKKTRVSEFNRLFDKALNNFIERTQK